MGNFNSTVDVIQRQNGGNPIVLAFPTTVGHQQFGYGIGNPAIASIPNPLFSVDGDKTFPGRSAQGYPFVVKAAGTWTLAAGVRYQIDINQGTGLAPAIASTGLIINATTTSDNWLLEFIGMWDAVSTNLRGVFYGWSGGVNIAQAPLVLSSPASLAALQFNVAATVLGPNPTNSFSLTEFSADFS